MPFVTSPTTSGPAITGQPRIPKLSYRNSSIETSTTGSRISTSSIGTAVTSETFATSLASPSPSEAPSFGSRSPAASSERSAGFPGAYGPTGKKKSSLFGFFSVKDPSIAAMQQYEEQMKKEGTYKKDTAPRPLLKSTQKWDGRPETLAKQKREAKARAEEQKKKETQEIIKEMERRGRELAKRRSLGSSDPRISRSMENVNTFGDAFGFEVHSTSTLGSENSNSNSNQRHPFPPTQSDYSGAAKSRSQGGSLASDGESQRGRTSLRHEGSTRSLSSSSPSDISPFIDRDLPGLPEIPPEYRQGKISKPLPAIPLIVPHRHVLPTVIEPPDESSADPPIRAFSVPSPLYRHPTDPVLMISTLPTPPHSAKRRGKSLSPSKSSDSVASISPLDEEVVVRSSGAHILGPPSTVKRKVPHVPFLAGEAQEMELPDEYSSPPSILKSKYATSRRMSLPARPLIPNRSNTAECATRKPSVVSRFRQPPGTAIKCDSLPRKDTEATEGERYEPERNTTPTPAPGGRGLFRSGRLGLFAKDKNER